MEELVNLTEIENAVALFCVATYGEGDPTDNAHDFFDWLHQDDIEMDGLKYAVRRPNHFKHFSIFTEWLKSLWKS